MEQSLIYIASGLMIGLGAVGAVLLARPHNLASATYTAVSVGDGCHHWGDITFARNATGTDHTNSESRWRTGVCRELTHRRKAWTHLASG